MTSSPTPARFPAWWCIAALSGAAGLAAVVAQPMVAFLVRSGPELRPAVLTMSLIAWAIAVVGLAPVILLGPLGVMGTVWGYFAGSAMRVMLGLAGWFIASTTLDLPGDMTGLALVIAYLPLLFVEVGFVARYLWEKDAAAVADRATGTSTTGLKASKVLA